MQYDNTPIKSGDVVEFQRESTEYYKSKGLYVVDRIGNNIITTLYDREQRKRMQVSTKAVRKVKTIPFEKFEHGTKIFNFEYSDNGFDGKVGNVFTIAIGERSYIGEDDIYTEEYNWVYTNCVIGLSDVHTIDLHEIYNYIEEDEDGKSIIP